MRILVTAGPTREYLDSVRFLSNPSTGKMGYAVARKAQKRGHEVILVSGPVALRPPRGVDYRPVVSAREMARACLEVFDDVDAVVMTAAVSDFRPKRRLARKQKKTQAGRCLELVRTPDILAAMGRRKQGQRLVGFAVEDRRIDENARLKLLRKRLDLIVANRPSAFGADRSDVSVIAPTGPLVHWADIAKGTLARRLVRFLETGRLPGAKRPPQ